MPVTVHFANGTTRTWQTATEVLRRGQGAVLQDAHGHEVAALDGPIVWADVNGRRIDWTQ